MNARTERERANGIIRKWVYDFRTVNDRDPSYDEMIQCFPSVNKYSYSGFIHNRGRDEHLMNKIIRVSNQYFDKHKIRPNAKTLSELMPHSYKALARYFEQHPELAMYKVNSAQGAKGKVDLIVKRDDGSYWAAEFHVNFVDIWQVAIHGERQTNLRMNWTDFQSRFMDLVEAGYRKEKK